MPVTIAGIRTEIQDGALRLELAPFVAAGNHSRIAEILNETRVAFDVSIVAPRVLVIRKLLTQGLHEILIPPATVDHASKKAAWVLFNHPDFSAGIDFSDSAFVTLLDNLQAANQITGAQKAALIALGTRKGSAIEVRFGAANSVNHEQVAQALRG